MLWRHLCLVRACTAAGLAGGILWLGGASATAQVPAPATAAAVEPSAPPADVPTATVDVLQAGRSGDLVVTARGNGQDKVRMILRNTTTRRLNVVVPPGLVAAAKVAQGAGGGGGRGMQSIGLGSVSNRPGAFGEFAADEPAGGLRSIPVTGEPGSRSVAVPAGETVEVTIPGVCLNYGLAAPSPRDALTVMDVDAYTNDLRVRKALRTLATLGTSHGVAQAVMWRVCNDLSFDEMMAQAGKLMNEAEIALAARFVEALDESGSSESPTLPSAAIGGSRILVRVEGTGPLAGEANRLNGQLGGLRILGLPMTVADGETLPPCSVPAMAIKVVLGSARTGEVRGRIVVTTCTRPDAWSPLGNVAFKENSSISVIDGAIMARAIDRAVSGAFVTVKPAHRAVGSTTLKVENRLPFTVSGLVVKAGTSLGDPSVPFEAVGVGPARAATLPLQAATASLVEHVQLNGL